MARKKSLTHKKPPKVKVKPTTVAVKHAENTLGYNPYNGRPKSYFGATP